MTDDNSTEADDVPFLSADNKAELMGCYAVKFGLSAVGDLAACNVMIRSASFARVNAFRRASDGKNERNKLRELCELIGESVVDEAGGRVWESDEVKNLSQSNTQRFMELQHGVLQVNGLTEEGKNLEELEDDEGKK